MLERWTTNDDEILLLGFTKFARGQFEIKNTLKCHKNFRSDDLKRIGLHFQALVLFKIEEVIDNANIKLRINNRI